MRRSLKLSALALFGAAAFASSAGATTQRTVLIEELGWAS